MAPGRWKALVIASAVSVGMTWDAVAANESARLAVYVENYAGVPARELATAQAEVEDVFLAAGVQISWRRGGSPIGSAEASGNAGEPRRLTLLVVNVQTAAGSPKGSALGLAVRARSRAFVFYNRVLDIGGSRPVDNGVILGRVMAHEIGHLLLPPGPHTHYGLMRGEVDLDGTNPSRFTRDEASSIRASLVQPPGQ